MSDETPAFPDNILGCTSCGAFFRWIDDRMTVKDHTVRGRSGLPECFGSGTQGVDLGPRSLYTIDGSAELIHLGAHTEPMIGLQCPDCRNEVSVRRPPDGAFHRRLRVHIECPRCGQLIALADMRESPQGVWVPRRHAEYW